MSMGELTRKDNSLCFRKDGKNVYIPIENTKEIYCMNEVTVNTKLLDFCHRITLSYIFSIIMKGTVVHFIRKISITAED